MFLKLEITRFFISDVYGLNFVKYFEVETKSGFFLKQSSQLIGILKKLLKFFENELKVFFNESQILLQLININLVFDVTYSLFKGA